MKLQSLAVSMVALLGLSACDLTGPLQDLKTSQPTGSRFTQSLAASYLAFSQKEANNYDWFNSRHFALKGLAAAGGEAVSPENPADWDIDTGPSQGDLAALRVRLIVALDAGRDRAPDMAATAQTGYDCWLEELSEGWETNEIEACHKQFMTSLETLEGGTPMANEQDRYQVFFDFAAYQIDPIARQIIAEAAKAIAQSKSTNIVVIGHTDRAGSTDFNMALSSRRAEMVKRALVEFGIPADRIHAVAQGESDLLVPTADGVREPQNRRVVVRF